MSTQVPWPMFVDYFSPFALCCDSGIKDDSCQLIVGNDGFECSVGANTILSEAGDTSVTESSNEPTQDCESSNDKCVSWSDFVLSVDNDRSIVQERITLEDGSAEGSVGVSESYIPMELENGNA